MNKRRLFYCNVIISITIIMFHNGVKPILQENTMGVAGR
jgi:hypothetical protein